MTQALSPAERRRKARAMHRSESKPSIREIAEALGVSHGTIHRDVNQEAAKRYAEQARKYKRRTPAAEREVTK